MSFFNYMPRVNYKFGNETTPDVFENIALYADVIDQVKDNISVYQDYYILPDERPDQVSFKLYDTTNYHWTFFLMNNNIRERGWPLSNEKLFNFAKKEYDHTIIVTKAADLSNKFKIGETITGLTSGVVAVIVHREINLGQLWVEKTSLPFTNGEQLLSSTGQTLTLDTSEIQYNSVHHYEDANGKWQDLGFELDGTRSDPAALWTPVTWLDRLIKSNNELNKIRVIDKKIINKIVTSFREAVAL